MTRPELRPWHTNLALALIGCALVCFTRQLISENDGFTIGFSGVSSSQVILYVAAILIFLIKPTNTDRYTFPIILTFAILCRLVALFPDPFLSSDVYRYAWDGVVQHAGISPYRYVPGNPILTFLREPNADLFSNMNRRDYAHTIYPPGAQLIFFCITFISPTVTAMKLAMVLFEALTLFGLTRILRHLGRPREWTLLYAWCPLLIWEIAGSGHLDAIIMAFLTLACLFRLRRQPVLTGLFLGLAILTKFYPLVLVPAFYTRRDWKLPATLAALAIACYAPYLSAGKLVFGFLGGYVEEEGMATGARYFLLEAAEHLHALPKAAFVLFAALVFSALMFYAWRRATPPASPPAAFLPPALALAVALMLLFSPHYPWYVAWLVPFLVLLPSLTLLTYIMGLFYLCTTALAVGSGPLQFQLNQFLYSTTLAALIIEVALRNLPQTRAWFARTLPINPVALSLPRPQ